MAEDYRAGGILAARLQVILDRMALAMDRMASKGPQTGKDALKTIEQFLQQHHKEVEQKLDQLYVERTQTNKRTNERIDT
jgi:hypothetical protein